MILKQRSFQLKGEVTTLLLILSIGTLLLGTVLGISNKSHNQNSLNSYAQQIPPSPSLEASCKQYSIKICSNRRSDGSCNKLGSNTQIKIGSGYGSTVTLDNDSSAHFTSPPDLNIYYNSVDYLYLLPDLTTRHYYYMDSTCSTSIYLQDEDSQLPTGKISGNININGTLPKDKYIGLQICEFKGDGTPCSVKGGKYLNTSTNYEFDKVFVGFRGIAFWPYYIDQSGEVVQPLSLIPGISVKANGCKMNGDSKYCVIWVGAGTNNTINFEITLPTISPTVTIPTPTTEASIINVKMRTNFDPHKPKEIEAARISVLEKKDNEGFTIYKIFDVDNIVTDETYTRTIEIDKNKTYILQGIACSRDYRDDINECEFMGTPAECSGVINKYQCIIKGAGSASFAFIPMSQNPYPIPRESPTITNTPPITIFKSPTPVPTRRITPTITLSPTQRIYPSVSPTPVPTYQLIPSITNPPLQSPTPSRTRRSRIILDLNNNGYIDVTDFIFALRSYGQTINKDSSEVVKINSEFISQIISQLGRKVD